MNKSDIINIVSRQTNINKTDTRKIVRVIFETISTALGNGDKITIIGFGSFKPVERAARKGRHPQTREIIQIKAKTTIKFRPSKHLLIKQ